MTDDAPDGTVTKAGWPQKKFYLSPEAIALLEAHCTGTPLTMSAYLDMLIKQNLGAPQELRSMAERRETLGATDRGEPPAIAEERARKAALQRGIGEVKSALLRDKTDDYEKRQDAQRQQPTKKDFKLDV